MKFNIEKTKIKETKKKRNFKEGDYLQSKMRIIEGKEPIPDIDEQVRLIMTLKDAED